MREVRILARPGNEAVAHDCQQPDPNVAVLEGVEIAIRPQIGLLRHVLGIRRVAGQPACQVVRRVEMREGQALEAPPPVVTWLGQGRVLPASCRGYDRRMPQVIPHRAGFQMPLTCFAHAAIVFACLK